ncbi:MAG: hypothetical protein ACKO34_03730 [Vampirovibrionales bacterium]
MISVLATPLLNDTVLQQATPYLQLGLFTPLLEQLTTLADTAALPTSHSSAEGLRHYVASLTQLIHQAYQEQHTGNTQQWISELLPWCQAPYRSELTLVLDALFPLSNLHHASHRLVRWSDGHRLQSQVPLPHCLEEQAVLTTAWSPLHWLLLGQQYTRAWLKEQGHEASNELIALVQLRKLGPAYALACLTASNPPLQVKQALLVGLKRWFPQWGLTTVEESTNEEWLHRAESIVPQSLAFEDTFHANVCMVRERLQTLSFVSALPQAEAASNLYGQLQQTFQSDAWQASENVQESIYPLLRQVTEAPVHPLELLTAAWLHWLGVVQTWQEHPETKPATATDLGQWLQGFNQRLFKSIETAHLHRLVLGDSLLKS